MRRIKQANVQRLALCKRGKNLLTTLYKSDGTAEWRTIVKADAEAGELLAVMWPKGLADADGDFADADVAIKSMTSSLILNGGVLDIEHEGEPLKPEQARITEVFLIQASDTRFHGWKDYSGSTVDVTGGAAVRIQIDDPALRQSYRNGDWDGVSMFGPAAVEHVDLKAASQNVAARMGSAQSLKKEHDMTPEELKAALAAQKAEIAEMVKSAIAGAMAEQKSNSAPEAASAEAAPTFTGNPLDPQALAEYEQALRGFELRKAIAAGTMTADKLAELRKSLQATQPSVAELVEAGIAAKESDSPQVRELQVKLFKAQKGSNAPASRQSEPEQDQHQANVAEATLLAKSINALLGTSARVA